MHDYTIFIDKISIEKTVRDLNKLIKIISEAWVTDEGNQKGVNTYNSDKYNFVHGRLRWFKYVPNQPKKNTIDVNPNAAFWKCIYDDISKTNSNHELCTEDRQKIDLEILEEIKSLLFQLGNGISDIPRKVPTVVS